MSRTLTAACLLGACLTPSVQGQVFIEVLRDGDTVAGVGAVTSISNLVLNDSGAYLIEVDTDNADTNADGALIDNLGPVLIENQSLTAPTGALLDSFDTVNLNGSGDSCWNFFLDGTSGSSDDSGVYFNTTLVIQESNVSTAPELTAGTPYIGFFEVKLNGAGDALVMASVDDPAIASGVDRALVRFDLDASGNLLSESAFIKEGDTPATLLGDAVTDFETGPHNFAFNDSGLSAYTVDCTSGFGGNNALFRGSELIAREGSPSPVPGRSWASLSSRPLALNNNGTLLWRGDVDGDTADDELLVLTNIFGTSQVLARQGDTMATSTGVFRITDFGSSAPLGLSDDGDTLYFVDLDDPDTSRDECLVLNGRILVQEGVTPVGVDTIESIGSGVQELFSLSPSGDFLILECKLTGGVDAVVLVDLTLGHDGPFCDGSDGSLSSCPCDQGAPSAGCDIASGTGGVHLSLLTVQTTPVNRATVIGNGYPTAGTPASVVIRASALDTGSPVVFGDGLRCVGVPIVRLGATLAVAGRSRHTFGHGAMQGAGTFYYQAWFRNTPIMYCDPTAAFNLSNGHRITW